MSRSEAAAFDLSIGSITDATDGVVWTSERLVKEIGRRIPALVDLGVCPGTYVAIYHGNTPELFADLLAVWQLGACGVCLDPTLSEAELTNIVNYLKPKALLVAPSSGATGGLPVPVVCGKELGGPPAQLLRGVFGGQLDDDALVLFTSGTTGTPKGVVHTFRSILARTALNRMRIGDLVMSRTLCTLPTHFGHGLIGNCLTPLLAGHDLVLFPISGVRAASDLGRVVDRHSVTFMSSVPATWRLALKFSEPPTQGTLQLACVGSGPLSGALWQEAIDWCGTASVANMYGITEAANWIAGASSDTFSPADGLVGKTWGGSAMVLDDDGRIRARGAGEIVLQSPSMMRGYLHQPEMTKNAFIGGWYRTGDVGRIDESGVIWLMGRKGNEINRGGVKVQPEDVELVLSRHPALSDACVFGLPDMVVGEIVAAAVAFSAPGLNHEVSDLEPWCRQRISPHKVPTKWFVVDEIPRTPNGKIRRRQTMEKCLAQMDMESLVP